MRLELLTPGPEVFGHHEYFQYPLNNIPDITLLVPDYPWEQRRDMEKLHYNKLRYTLAHSWAENLWYKKEALVTTRQTIALSTDCISAISIYVRPPHLHLVAYFRSSHRTNLLPVDLEFLFNLPSLWLQDVEHICKTFDHQLPQLTTGHWHLSWGSLHG